MARVFTLGNLVLRCKQRVALENSGLVGSVDTTEWKALVSAAFGALRTIVIDAGANYFKNTRTITTIAATNATSTMLNVAKASLVDGETFSIGDMVFEFDTDGSVEDGHVSVDISSAVTAGDVGDAVVTAVNAATYVDGGAFGVTASNFVGIVTLTADDTGEVGNMVCSNDVAAADFSLPDVLGGGQTYRIPADHLSTIGVFYVDSSGYWRALEERMAQHFHHDMGISSTAWATDWSIEGMFLRLMPFPPAGQTYKLQYVPNSPDLSTRTDSYKVDVITDAGAEFIIAHVGVNALSKENSPVGGQLAARNSAKEQVELWAVRRALHSAKQSVMNDAPYGQEGWLPGDYLRGGRR